MSDDLQYSFKHQQGAGVFLQDNHHLIFKDFHGVSGVSLSP
jgi:hypothetical protein